MFLTYNSSVFVSLKIRIGSLFIVNSIEDFCGCIYISFNILCNSDEYLRAFICFDTIKQN